jgi:Flp pilus assembly protein TadG
MRALHLVGRFKSALCRLSGEAASDDRGSQIVEFAVSLPLLVLFVIGIFDFSGAITLKQKLTNAAREGARVAAADPANDLAGSSAPLPASVGDALQVVDNYLLAEGINDCGLSRALPTPSGTLTWSTTVNSCPGAGALKLTINRGCLTPQTSGQTTIYEVNTCVTLVYPYSWQFGGVAGLFGNSFTLPISITTTAAAFNEN